MGVVIKVEHERSLSVGNVQYLDCGDKYTNLHTHTYKPLINYIF